MKIIDLIKKAFIGGDWSVGYRERGTEKYSIIPVDKGWIADPFLFEHKGENYLFVEYVNGNKGEIAYFKFIDNKPVFQKVIISEPYHLSYPCVFTHGTDVYIIPESADNHCIDLYIATEFPNQWEKVKRLKRGLYYDTTYFNYSGRDYLIGFGPMHNRHILSLFSIDLKNKTLQLILEKEYIDNIGRPAGNLFLQNDILIRPAQNCSRKYGENIIFYSVKGLEKNRFEEEIVKTVSSRSINSEYHRIHTYNRDTKYEVIDLYKEHIKLSRPFTLILKKTKQVLSRYIQSD